MALNLLLKLRIDWMEKIMEIKNALTFKIMEP